MGLFLLVHGKIGSSPHERGDGQRVSLGMRKREHHVRRADLRKERLTLGIEATAGRRINANLTRRALFAAGLDRDGHEGVQQVAFGGLVQAHLAVKPGAGDLIGHGGIECDGEDCALMALGGGQALAILAVKQPHLAIHSTHRDQTAVGAVGDAAAMNI